MSLWRDRNGLGKMITHRPLIEVDHLRLRQTYTNALAVLDSLMPEIEVVAGGSDKIKMDRYHEEMTTYQHLFNEYKEKIDKPERFKQLARKYVANENKKIAEYEERLKAWENTSFWKRTFLSRRPTRPHPEKISEEYITLRYEALSMLSPSIHETILLLGPLWFEQAEDFFHSHILRFPSPSLVKPDHPNLSLPRFVKLKLSLQRKLAVANLANAPYQISEKDVLEIVEWEDGSKKQFIQNDLDGIKASGDETGTATSKELKDRLDLINALDAPVYYNRKDSRRRNPYDD
jgi:hypothetical protein